MSESWEDSLLLKLEKVMNERDSLAAENKRLKAALQDIWEITWQNAGIPDYKKCWHRALEIVKTAQSSAAIHAARSGEGK